MDCHSVDAMEVHCHGPSSSEGVAADVIFGVTKFVEPDEFPCISECVVDLFRVNSSKCVVPGLEFVVKDVVEQGATIA